MSIPIKGIDSSVDGIAVEPGTIPAPATFRIDIVKDGPYLVYGQPPLTQKFITPNADGEPWTFCDGESFELAEATALCRCGQSAHKPFCDGTHKKVGFDGSETASRAPLLAGAELEEGPVLNLTDNKDYCAYARFCDGHGQVWNLVMKEGERAAELTRHEAGHCPGGRLKAWQRNGMKPLEPALPPSLGLIEDPAIDCSAGLWVRGGIRIRSSDGSYYEIRNRVTLCRCGRSANKPFCDGAHATCQWQDGLPATRGATDEF